MCSGFAETYCRRDDRAAIPTGDKIPAGGKDAAAVSGGHKIPAGGKDAAAVSGGYKIPAGGKDAAAVLGGHTFTVAGMSFWLRQNSLVTSCPAQYVAMQAFFCRRDDSIVFDFPLVRPAPSSFKGLRVRGSRLLLSEVL